MNPIYHGDNTCGTAIVVTGLSWLDPRTDVARIADHFDWGNGATPGARQLALALLAHFTGDARIALALHEPFAKMVLADLGEAKWHFTADDMHAAVAAVRMSLAENAKPARATA